MHDWEGRLLLMIQFENHSLCSTFYEQLSRSLHTYDNSKIALSTEEDGEFINLCIQFSAVQEEEIFERKLLGVILANITIHIFLTEWLERIVRDQFYYKDAYEIETIVATAKDMFLNNDVYDVPLQLTFQTWQREMVHLFEVFLLESSHFSFNSFLRFRLKKQRENLKEVVEKAIEEYKYEYDYQQILHICRNHLKNTPPKVDVVHIYIDKEIYITDENGEEIPYTMIRNWLTNELTFEYPLPLEERIISPLVAIAPSSVIVHLKRHDEGLIQTLLSIFEERVTIMENKPF